VLVRVLGHLDFLHGMRAGPERYQGRGDVSPRAGSVGPLPGELPSSQDSRDARRSLRFRCREWSVAPEDAGAVC
jgi:hypothetical protein